MMTCHFFVLNKVKLEKSVQKLQIAGGWRGREAGPEAAALGGAWRRSEEFAESFDPLPAVKICQFFLFFD